MVEVLERHLTEGNRGASLSACNGQKTVYAIVTRDAIADSTRRQGMTDEECRAWARAHVAELRDLIEEKHAACVFETWQLDTGSAPVIVLTTADVRPGVRH